MVATKLDEFTRAYIECALWSSTDNSTESGGYPLDQNYGTEDIAAETLAKIIDDCERFQRDHAELLAEAEYNRGEWSNSQMAGHDFWLTRNHHGAGFWDRGLGDIGQKLTEAAHIWGEVDLYVGDDGKLYL